VKHVYQTKTATINGMCMLVRVTPQIWHIIVLFAKHSSK